jgi:hypothetical protein
VSARVVSSASDASGSSHFASAGDTLGHVGIKETMLGWLRSTPDKNEELEDAEADELTREYSADRADTVAGFELGGGRGDFESDQEAPHR